MKFISNKKTGRIVKNSSLRAFLPTHWKSTYRDPLLRIRGLELLALTAFFTSSASRHRAYKKQVALVPRPCSLMNTRQSTRHVMHRNRHRLSFLPLQTQNTCTSSLCHRLLVLCNTNFLTLPWTNGRLELVRAANFHRTFTSGTTERAPPFYWRRSIL